MVNGRSAFNSLFNSAARRDLPPAIVVSGHTMALGVVRALGQMGVPVVVVHYDPQDVAHASRHVVAHYPSPHPEHQTENFLQVLRECARRFGGGVLIPASDESLVAVSRNKDLLTRDFTVACPDWETVRTCIDKRETSVLAEGCGVPTPRTLVPRNCGEVEQYAREVEFPCLVKPRKSHLFYERFRQKMFRVGNPSEMMGTYRQATEAGLEIMLQEIIPGDDTQVVNYNAFAVNGTVRTEFTAVHIRNAPTGFGSPRVALGQHIPEVIPPGRRILEALSYHGYACTEFKRDPRDGVFKLMDINARHNLTTLLAVACGLNFPWLEYRYLVFGELPAAGSSFRTGVYWVDILRDLVHSAKCRKDERYSLGSYLRPYVKAHINAILDWRDPLPFIQRCTFLAGQGLRALATSSVPWRKEEMETSYETSGALAIPAAEAIGSTPLQDKEALEKTGIAA